MQESIKYATHAMALFMQSLPTGCFFNIFRFSWNSWTCSHDYSRFGSDFQFLYPECRQLTNTTIKEARDYIAATKADLGGTVLDTVLPHIFNTETKRSRQIFLLTGKSLWNFAELLDGEVNRTDTVISLVCISMRLFDNHPRLQVEKIKAEYFVLAWEVMFQNDW